MLTNSEFPKLKELGILDSEIQDELAEIVCGCKYMGQIETLDLSCGTLTDQGGQVLLEQLPKYGNIKKVDLGYHYMSEKMVDKLEELPMEVDASDPQEEEEYNGEIYRYPMLTE